MDSSPAPEPAPARRVGADSEPPVPRPYVPPAAACGGVVALPLVREAENPKRGSNGTKREEAEALFGQVLEVARRQETKTSEQRAATSLARLWQRRARATPPAPSPRSMPGSPKASTRAI